MAAPKHLVTSRSTSRETQRRPAAFCNRPLASRLLLAGAYNVTETVDSQYDASYGANCSGISLLVKPRLAW